MKNRKFNILIELIGNFILSFGMIQLISTFSYFPYIIVDILSWILTFIFLYLLKRKKKINSKYDFHRTIFNLLINNILLILLFVFMNIGYIKVKIISLLIIYIIHIFTSKNMKINNSIPYLILLIFIFSFLLISPLSPIGNGETLRDSSVFRYIGIMMTKGAIPYRDLFDHKGIFIYLINMLGYLINKDIGIWCIELLFLYTTVIFLYKTAQLFTNKFNAVISTIIVFFPMLNLFEFGNMVEEYAMPFIAISLYFLQININ